MVSMISINWDKTRDIDASSLPGGWVSFTFSRSGEILWCGYSANLARRLHYLRTNAENDKLHKELLELADTLQIEQHPDAICALIRHKVMVQQHNPVFQQRLHPWQDYVYLALNAYQFPFVSIREQISDDWIHAGPWRSRFFLSDVIETVSRLLKLPQCETGSFPCEKLDQGLCKGYCLALSENGESQDLEPPDLDKLELLLKEAFLHPENHLVDLLTQKRESYFNELEFAKADLLDGEIEQLNKYRDWLNFLYVSKALNFSNPGFSVEKGLLRSASFEGREYFFPLDDTLYRENEALALNLHNTDEARLIYEYHLNTRKG